MSVKNKNVSPNPERSRAIPVILGGAVGAVAVGVVVGGANHLSNVVEPDKAAAKSTKSSEVSAQFEHVTDLPVAMQDQLLYIQASHDKDFTLSPTEIPVGTLNQVGQPTLVILEGAGGLAEQATDFYRAEHGLQDGQETPETVQDSITVSTKALSQRNRLEHKDDVINGGDTFDLLELKDAEGNDYVIVGEPTTPINN